MADTLTTSPVEHLMFLSRQMTATIIDFGTGVRDRNVRNGNATLSIAIGLLRRVQSVARERNLSMTGPEWGPNVEGIISASGLDRDEWRA